MRTNKRILIMVTVFCLLISSVAYGETNYKSLTVEEKFKYMDKIMDYIEASYKYGATKDDMLDGAMKGLFQGLDQHSLYFSPDEYEDFNVSANGVFVGIGVSVAKRNGVVTVLNVLPGTPAEKAGMFDGDKIVRIDGVDIDGFVMDKTISKLRGERGSEVIVGVTRKGNSDIIDLKIIRDTIKVNTVTHKILEDNVGLITIENFNQNTVNNVKKVFDIFKEEKVKGCIIDLRNNPGGSLSQVLLLADNFVEKDKPLLHVSYKDDKSRVYYSNIDRLGMPLVVLVNERSASASEIFAAAIKENEAGVVIGTTTYGKGTVQKLTKLMNGGAIKLTVAEYLTPLKNKINGVGLTPNIVVNNPESDKLKELSDFVPMIENRDSVLNDRGLDIYGAQQRLRFIGYSTDLTGIMDQHTSDIIGIFQESVGQEGTGILDAETKVQLQKKVRIILNGGVEDRQMETAFETIKDIMKKK